MNKRIRKILFAPVDIGMRIEQYCRLINERHSDSLFAESLVVVPGPAEYYVARYTRTFSYLGRTAPYRWARSLLNFLVALARYDLFHFLSGETLLTRRLRRWELAVYKALGRTVIMHFVGADIRSVGFLTWKSENIVSFLEGRASAKETDPWQDDLIEDAKRYADSILVSTPDLLRLVPQARYFPVVLDTDAFLSDLKAAPARRPAGGPVVIVHSPSNKLLKGSSLIHEALRRVAARSRHPVTLHLPAEESRNRLYSLPRRRLLELYNEADIVIDQMVIGWYGLQAVEALAAGAQVICHIDPRLESYRFPGCPIVSADPRTLEETVERCIEIAASGSLERSRNLSWVRRFHDLRGNDRGLLEAWGL